MTIDDIEQRFGAERRLAYQRVLRELTDAQLGQVVSTYVSDKILSNVQIDEKGLLVLQEVVNRLHGE